MSFLTPPSFSPLLSSSPPPSDSSFFSPSSCYYLLFSTAESIFNSISATRRVSAQQLETLHFLFPNLLLRALEIHETSGLTLVRARQSGRFAFIAQGAAAQSQSIANLQNSNPNNQSQNDSQSISDGLNSSINNSSSSSGPYLCSFYRCTCPYFLHQVLSQNSIYCKHQLAARLSFALQDDSLLARTELDDEKFDEFLLRYEKTRGAEEEKQNSSAFNSYAEPAVNSKQFAAFPQPPSNLVPYSPALPNSTNFNGNSNFRQSSK